MEVKEIEKTKKTYAIFTIIFGVIALFVVILILRSGITPERAIPSVNPYYTENVNYPPKGAEKVGIIALLSLLFLYFVADCSIGYRLRGWKKFLFIFAWIFAIFFIMETSMGFYVKKFPPLHRPHPSFLWELYPGRKGQGDVGGVVRSLAINRFGFRGDEITTRKPPNTFRIMVLGDSSAFGYGMHQDQTFPFLLQKELQEKYPMIHIEVINAAVPGYTTFSTLNFFREKGIKFAPDAIIISHNNDPDIDWDEDKNRAAPIYLQPILKVLYHSNIYMTIRREILNARLRKEPHFFREVPEGKGVARVSPKDFEKNLGEILKIAKKNGIRILVISMPRLDEEDFTLSYYRGIMENVTEKYGGIFLDLFHEWQEFPSEELFMDNIHPNEEGQSKIAWETAEVIMKERWIK